jgi:hypothetical protein
MIVEKKEQLALINSNSKSFKIAQEFEYEVMKMLTSKLYPDPIKAVIQEYISNAYDAMVTAKTLDSRFINVSLKPDASGQWYFIVQDEGSGMTEDIVEKYFMSLGASESRGEGDKIGAKGLGAKCAFAYSPVFQLRTRVDGKEYHYAFSMTEQEMGGNLFNVTDTDAHNGSIVSIPVKANDAYSFAYTIKHTIPYFRNVKLDVNWSAAGFHEAYEPEPILTYKVKDKPLFKVTNQCSYGQMHVVLGQVHYPINWNTLGLAPIWSPVAVHIGLDEGIDVTPNRSEILYTEATKKKLVNKIQDVCKYITKLYEQDAKKEYDDMGEWLRAFKQAQKQNKVHYTFTYGDTTYPMDINDIIIAANSSKSYPTLKGFFEGYPYKNLHLSKLYAGFNHIATINSEGKRKTSNLSATSVLSQDDLSSVLLLQGSWSRNKNTYLASGTNVYEYDIVRKKVLIDSDIAKILGVSDDSSDLTAKYIADFKKFTNFIETQLTTYEGIDVDAAWLADYRKQKKKLLQDGKTTVTIYYGTGKHRETKALSSLRRGGLNVYGQFNNSSDESMIRFLAEYLGHTRYTYSINTKRPQFMLVAKGNIKTFDAEPNSVNVWEWIENQPKIIYLLATWVRNSQVKKELVDSEYAEFFKTSWGGYEGAYRRFPSFKPIDDLTRGRIITFSIENVHEALKQQVEDALAKGMYDHTLETEVKLLPSVETINELDKLCSAVRVGSSKLANKIFVRNLIDSAIYAGLGPKDAAHVRKMLGKIRN